MSKARLNAELSRSSGVTQTISSTFSTAKEIPTISHCQGGPNGQAASSWPEVEVSAGDNALGEEEVTSQSPGMALGFIPYQFEWSYPFFGGRGRKLKSTGTRQHLASQPETVHCVIAFNQKVE